MRYYMPVDKCRNGIVVKFPKGDVKFIRYGGRCYALSNNLLMNGSRPPAEYMYGFQYGWIASGVNDAELAMFDFECDLPRKLLSNRRRNWKRTFPKDMWTDYYCIYTLRNTRAERNKPPIEKHMAKCHFTGKYFHEQGESRAFYFCGEMVKAHPSIDVGICVISRKNVFVGHSGVKIGGYYCHEDYSEYIEECADCGVEFINRNCSVNDSSEPVCDACESNYFTCSDCDNVFHVNSESEEYYMCQDCYNERYIECEFCGERCDREDYDYDMGCRDCASSVISDYDTKFPERSYGDERRFGVEIELECDRSDRYRNAKEMGSCVPDALIKSDGSLDEGFEVVTPPLLYQDAIDMAKKIAEKGNDIGMWGDADEDCNARGSQTCGVHVHVSRASMTQHTLAKMLLVFSECKEDVELIARRDCDQWACVHKKDKKKLIED